ncbi:CoA transferase [Blastococcus sp. SYSU D00669]
MAARRRGEPVPRCSALFETAWQALGGNPPGPDAYRVTGRTGLGGPLDVDDLAIGAVLAQLTAARDLTGRSAPIDLDARHVGVAFRSERYVRQGGRPVGPGFAELSRFWRTRDGWLRLHANYPHHRRTALAVLGEDPGAAAAAADAEALETAVVAAGGAAAAVRSEQEWAEHPQGRAVAGLPLLSLDRVAGGPAVRASLPGLRVLDLTRVIAGPVATRTLASHGADVLRIDSPRLPEDPGTLLDTGPGKRHAVLDFGERSGRTTLEELLGAADVVVQGHRPGALDRFGLAPAALAERHPHLVVVRLSAWGQAGPWRQRRGFDSLVQAATGIALRYATGEAPGVLPAQALDHATGHLAAAAALRGLARRQEEGGAWHAELSLAQAAHWLLAGSGTGGPATGDLDDAMPYLVDLPAPGGPVTTVAPPGSPVWRHGPVPAGHDEPRWWPGRPER